MDRQSVLEQLAEIICSVECTHPVRVAIDGVDAAGKTTLADELAPLIEKRNHHVIRASIDGFHLPKNIRYRKGENSPEGYYEDSFDLARIRENLLKPLGSGGNRKYCPAVFDVHADKPVIYQWMKSPENAILLFDGVFLLRPALSDYWDFLIFVDVDFMVSVMRAVTRDQADAKSELPPQKVLEKYNQRYVPGQRIYLSEVQPKSKANIIVDNNDLEKPKLILNN